MIGSLGKRYARALLALAREDGALEPTGEDIARAAATFDEPRLRAVVLSPAIAPSARLRITRQVVTALGLSRNVGNLVSLLGERDRLHVLGDIARWYENLVDEALGRTRAHIRSAVALGVAEKAELVELARRLTGRREVRASVEIDPELLGGVVLDAAGTVYDGSIRTQLERLGREMALGGT
jgi:F-type H+-transporting ATPase subunit delta